ncbi:hypothetical protein D9758_011901 [Tetrapyrgos nigripes]|uniref:F-box protein n=1 Tax=Tetrapyrgos nigripes TaxID=182062 RepID=A0A8H5CQ19_9AGAR|nr:hypothetical protein D9758_011901 [Tetrapyrgos nigripes]
MKPGQKFPPSEVVADWLDRSAGLSLEIFLHVVPELQPAFQEPSDLDSLLQSSQRWKWLILDLAPTFVERLLTRAELNFAMLEIFLLVVPWIYSPTKRWTALETASSLRHVGVRTPLSHSVISCLAFPTSHITNFRFQGGSPNVLTDLITSCPLLKICQLSIPGCDEEDFRVREPVELRHLADLEICFETDTGLPEFFDALTLPSLRVLDMEHSEDVDEDSENPALFPALMSLHARSRFKLEVMLLERMPELHTENLIDLLRANPIIEMFNVDHCRTSISELTKTFLATTHTPVVAPNLVKLGIDEEEEFLSREDFDNVVDMVISRWKPYPPDADFVVQSRNANWGFGDVGSTFKWPVRKLQEGVFLRVGFSVKDDDSTLQRLRAVESEGMPLLFDSFVAEEADE